MLTIEACQKFRQDREFAEMLIFGAKFTPLCDFGSYIDGVSGYCQHRDRLLRQKFSCVNLKRTLFDEPKYGIDFRSLRTAVYSPHR